MAAQPTFPAPVIWSPDYEVDIGPHVFPTAKYRLVRERLLEEGRVREEEFVIPEPASWEELARVHTDRYLEKIRTGDFTPEEILLLELPFSPQLRAASILCAGGTYTAGRLALTHGVVPHLGGGFHHAFADHGEGFCLLNDVAVATRTLQAEDGVERVMIVDLDVHHGNGTAAIFRDDSSVFTFSMHQEWNYPAVKPPGDLDLGLEDGTEDEEYRNVLERHLPDALDRHRPEVVFYLAGADPYRDDQLGGLGLTLEGLRARDRFVFQTLDSRKAPVAVTLAGGYACRNEDTVEIHRNTVVEVLEAQRNWTRS